MFARVDSTSWRRRPVGLAILLPCASFALACGDAAVTLRPPPATDTTTIVAAPPYRPPTRAATVYQERGDPASPASLGATRPSRYVLYADSTFELQFSSANRGLFGYSGRFFRPESGLLLTLSGWSPEGQWAAQGALIADTLRVTYAPNNFLTISLSDGDYIRVR